MIEPKIIYEDENFLAVNKPSGMLVHAARTNAEQTQNNAENLPRKSALAPSEVEGSSPRVSAVSPGTLVDWLLKRYPEIKNVGDHSHGRVRISRARSASERYLHARPGIVHRLDRETSGVMIVAKNQKYFEYLKSLFQKHLIRKTYLALVFGKVMPKSGIIEKPIGIKSGTLKRSVHSTKMAKNSVTEYKVIKYLERLRPSSVFSFLEVEPKTGRTHQIRLHLASIGHPVVGDKLYGPKRNQPEWAHRLMLHALSLEFSSGNGRRTRIEAEPPEDYSQIIYALSL